MFLLRVSGRNLSYHFPGEGPEDSSEECGRDFLEGMAAVFLNPKDVADDEKPLPTCCIETGVLSPAVLLQEVQPLIVGECEPLSSVLAAIRTALSDLQPLLTPY